jgi:broad specificity phosphatase PhoE
MATRTAEISLRKRKTIYLIRHGEIAAQRNSEGNMLLYGDDVQLTDTGRIQIQSLGKKLLSSEYVPTLLVTSPLIRAYQTTEILRSMLDIPVIRDDRLGEEVPQQEINKVLIRDIVSRKWKPDPEEERRGQADGIMRMVSAVKDYTIQYPQDTIGFVSHGDSLRLCLYGLIHGEHHAIPPMGLLFRTNYLDKGEAWKIQLSSDFHIIEKEYIGRPPELWRRGERIS